MAERKIYPPPFVGVLRQYGRMNIVSSEDFALIVTMSIIALNHSLAALHAYVITLTGHQREVGLDFYQYAQAKMLSD